jgi:hypothetical protein
MHQSRETGRVCGSAEVKFLQITQSKLHFLEVKYEKSGKPAQCYCHFGSGDSVRDRSRAADRTDAHGGIERTDAQNRDA